MSALFKYGFCKKLLRYKWNSDQLNTFSLTLFPDQCWSGKKVFNWSEFHLYRSNLLQKKNWMVIMVKWHLSCARHAHCPQLEYLEPTFRSPKCYDGACTVLIWKREHVLDLWSPREEMVLLGKLPLLFAYLNTHPLDKIIDSM